MSLLAIEELQLAALPPGLLWGLNIETPQVGEARPGRRLALGGWVLGRSSPAVAVEVLYEGQVIRRAPLGAARPDLAAAFPQVPEAVRGGFRTSVSLLPGAATIELQLQAVLQDQRRVPLGLLRLRRPPLAVAQSGELPLVSVVIPCYNQAHFLPEAIESVLAQSYPRLELVVVDDGSSDNTAAVAARYPGVRCVQQPNQGLAGARNSGLRHSSGGYLVFLDADDRLLPHALQTGLDALLARPECAFVAGSCQFIASDGSPLPTPQPPRIESDHYAELLRRTYIWMPAVVMYRRAVLETMGGFDRSVDACADYDLYLRIARRFPIYCHGQVVAEYRRHGGNMSSNPALMLQTVLSVLRSQWEYVSAREHYGEAYRAGLAFWKEFYGEPLLDELLTYWQSHRWQQMLRSLPALRYYPQGLASVVRRIGPPGARSRYQEPALPAGSVPIGQAQLGSLRRVTPISHVFGYDRGLPVDRYYIEKFLHWYSEDIHGHVLEIGDNEYTHKFGGQKVSTSDVLHISEGNPRATIVADLTEADTIPSDTFDCIILTQTLQLIYDLRAAVKTLHRILKPGGTLLATVPGISPISQDEWGDSWCWSFTALSLRRLFEEFFPTASTTVEVYGNVLAAVAFLHGLSLEELRQEELEYFDARYAIVIALWTTKTPGDQQG